MVIKGNGAVNTMEAVKINTKESTSKYSSSESDSHDHKIYYRQTYSYSHFLLIMKYA